MKAFNTFSCIPLRDGTSVLYVAPDIICWSGETHRAMIAASVIAIIVYIIGIPSYVLSTMLYARVHDKLSDSEWLHVFGFMYTRYGKHHDVSHRQRIANETDCCRTGVLLVGARISAAPLFVLLLSGLSSLLSICANGTCPLVEPALAALMKHPRSPDYVECGLYAQIVAVCCIVFATLIQFLNKPFWDSRLDYLDCVCSLSIMLHVLSLAYFNNPNFYDEMDQDAPWFFETGLFGINCLALLTIASLFVTSLVKQKFTSYAMARMAQIVARSIVLLQEDLLCQRDAFLPSIRKYVAETPSLGIGVRVSHASHGLGEIKDTARNDDDKPCWDVVFDSGDRRYYPQANGPQKLLAVVQDVTSSHPKVTLRVFRLAVLHCIPHALPCVIEALYVLLQVLDAGEEALQSPTDVGVSIDLVIGSRSIF